MLLSKTLRVLKPKEAVTALVCSPKQTKNNSIAWINRVIYYKISWKKYLRKLKRKNSENCELFLHILPQINYPKAVAVGYVPLDGFNRYYLQVARGRRGYTRPSRARERIQEGWFEVRAHDVILRPRQQSNVLLRKSTSTKLRILCQSDQWKG
jgi:hypothetical protein